MYKIPKQPFSLVSLGDQVMFTSLDRLEVKGERKKKRGKKDKTTQTHRQIDKSMLFYGGKLTDTKVTNYIEKNGCYDW